MNDPITGFIGGGGGGGGCVTLDTLVGDQMVAGSVSLHERMDSIHPVTGVREAHNVTVVHKSLQPCLRITTDTGIVLECSESAPLANFNGKQVWADRLKLGDRVSVV